MKTRRIHPRASIVASVLLASGATAASLAWTGCSSPDGSESQGSALGANVVKNGIIISQVYGAGGNSGASLNSDYVELFNSGTTPVTMTGWTLQYASSGGTFTTSNSPSLLATATLQPGEYYLVAMGTASATVGAALPATDDHGTLELSGTSGTVALTTDSTVLTCTTAATCAAITSIVDVVGYGAAKNFTGTGPTGPAAGLSATTGAIRKGDANDDSCTNSGDNSMDFDIITESATTPRNSSTAKHVCAGGTTGGTGNGAGLLISQVYGGGGNANATYDADFVELFNPTAAAISTMNLSIQYGSAAGNFASPIDGGTDPNLVLLPAAMIPPGGYYLVQMGLPATTPVGAAYTSDFVGTAALGASAGKVALVNNTTALNCGATATPCTGTYYLDLVGYGTGVSAFEGTAAAPALSSILSAQRATGGCTNGKDNSLDFTAATPIIRNSGTGTNKCTGGAMDAGTDSGTDAGTDSGAGSMDSGTKDSGTGSTDAGAKDSGSGGEDSGSGGGGGGTGTGSSTFVISQVFGDGAYTATLPSADYVEIFNRSTSAQSLNGMSLQYGSAPGDFAVAFDGGDSSLIELPNVMVPAGGYFLVGLASGDAGTALPMADLTGQVNISYDNGKLALVDGTAALSSCGATGSLCPTTDFVDLVGYGTADQFEGSAATTTINGSGAGFRNEGGCTDTNDNTADFTTGTPAPRNSASPKNVCTGGGGGGGGSDSGTGGGGGGGGNTADSGSSGDDDDDDDDGGSTGSAGGGGQGVSMIVSDPNSGGCSTSGNSGNREGALAFGAFAAAVIAFNRRKKQG